MDDLFERAEHPDPDWRISEVVLRTGLSKELIHHYLRQGLVPKPVTPGRYTRQHVRLLRQVRGLREDHQLPLELIGRLFELFGYDPARLDSVTRLDSLGRRMSRLLDDGLLGLPDRLTAEQLAEQAGVEVAELSAYVDAGVVTPDTSGGEPAFSTYDADAIALCESGLRLGIPFSSFGTVASYVRIAFELERREFFRFPTADDPEHAIAGLFARREVAMGFVQSVLQAATHRRFQRMFQQDPAPDRSLDDVVYSPSAAFVARHRIDEAIAAARGELVARPDEPARWARAAELLLHGGRTREAAFLFDEALDRWPEDARLRVGAGRAKLLCGERDAGRSDLARSDDPLAAVLLALSTPARNGDGGRLDARLRADARTVARVTAALEASAASPTAARIEVALLAGWVLGDLPEGLDLRDRGLSLLLDAWTELGALAPFGGVPGLLERLRVNCAFLLLRRLIARPDAPGGAPDPEELRTAICRLDPGCEFAQRAFLSIAHEEAGEP